MDGSGFLSAPLLRPRFDGKTWVLQEPFSYDVGYPLSGDRITVPRGFECDLTSTPRILWPVIPRWGRHGPAAIIHDWLYHSRERPRAEADAIFLEATLVLGTPRAIAKAAYLGVRAGGWVHYR